MGKWINGSIEKDLKKKTESMKYILIAKDTFWTWKLKCLMKLLLEFNKC